MPRKKPANTQTPPAPIRILAALDLAYRSGRDCLNGIFSVLERTPNCETRLVSGTEGSYLPMLRDAFTEKIDGIIVKGVISPELLSLIRSANIPAVFITALGTSRRFPPNSAHVVSDNSAIGAAAARYFRSAGQYASFGYMSTEPENWSLRRLEGFARELKNHTVSAFLPTPKSHNLSISRSALRKWLLELPKPAAVFAAFDYAATFIFGECRKLGIRIPQDLAVLGVDDDPGLCEHTSPPLSSIRVDHTPHGETAAREILAMIRGKPAPAAPIVISTASTRRVIERASSAYLPQSAILAANIQNLIDAHALDGAKVSTIVRAVGVSERLANLRYSHAKGKSIRAEITARRMAEARRLLSTTACTIASIARQCGYSSTIVFTHAFRRHHNQSPTQYRQSPK